MKRIYAVLIAGAMAGLYYVAKQTKERAEKDIVLIDQNVEALSQNEGAPGLFDPCLAWASVLASGDCGYKYEIYTVSWQEKGSQSKKSVDVYCNPKTGKWLSVNGETSFDYPSCDYEKVLKDVKIVITGHWRVCETSFHTCDRRLQILCDGTRSSFTTLKRPSNAL